MAGQLLVGPGHVTSGLTAIGWPWSCDLRADSHRKEADQTGSQATQGDHNKSARAAPLCIYLLVSFKK